MKHLFDWLKPCSQRKLAAEKSKGDMDKPFGWFGDDQADSSIFMTGSPTVNKSGRTVSDSVPSSGPKSLRDAENDEGFDPYNSGRFNAKTK